MLDYGLLYDILPDSLGSLEGVDGSWQPVDTPVTVQTARQTTVSTPAHLRYQGTAQSMRLGN